MNARRRARLLQIALIDLYDFVQNEFESEPYAHEIGSYIGDRDAKALANAILVERDERMLGLRP